MMHDSVIFDIDGTLWNASVPCAKGWNTVLRTLGMNEKVQAEDLQKVTGKPLQMCIGILLPGLQEQYPDILSQLSNEEIKILRQEGGQLYDGVTMGIQQLSSIYKIGLVSNCQSNYLDVFLDTAGIDSFLFGVDCYGRSGLSKARMLLTMKNTHTLSNPIYIGDTAGDEEAARLAGMDFIYAAYGFGTPIGKPVAFNSFMDIVAHLTNAIPKG